MAAFPYYYPHLLHMEGVFPPQEAQDLTTPCYYSSDGSIPATITSTNYVCTTSLDSVTKVPSPDPSQNKRKDTHKETGEGKRRRQRKCNNGEEPKEKEKKDEPPTGYIHVRARRGQATDSHSLAERVRREKIRERMKLLQELVPGCDKVIGKALMLDEIINYVQSLQSQVEFLSMKLASANPIMWDYALDDYFFEHEAVDRSPPLASVHQASHVQSTAFAVASNNCPLLDGSCPFLLHGHSEGHGDLHIQGSANLQYHQFSNHRSLSQSF